MIPELSAIIKTAQIAAALNVPVSWLFSLIHFESKYNPTIKNPYSSARGLLQFTNASARALGFSDSAALVAALPTAAEQLERAVLPYLARFRPFPTEQSLYMAVFYPAFRYFPENTPFPAEVRAVNPGINTIKDYILKVRGRFLSILAVPVAFVTAGFVISYSADRIRKKRRF